MYNVCNMYRCFIMILKITAALLLISQCSLSIPLDQFYPFGISERDQELSSDFVNSRRIFFSGSFSFYGRSISSLYVSLVRKCVKHM